MGNLQIKDIDNVLIALKPLNKGEKIFIQNKELEIKEEIPQGHKIALNNLKKGEQVIKYGHPIGVVTTDIKKGTWVHSHNLSTALQGKIKYKYQACKHKEKKETEIPSFLGYEREDKQVGIRNEIWIINTVGCINNVAEKLSVLATTKHKQTIKQGVIDGIFSFAHPYGCSQLGGDLYNTQKILAGLVDHPNAAGVLVLGLGCENNLIQDFQEIITPYNSNRIKFLNLQDVEDEIEEGLELIDNLVQYAQGFSQKKLAISKLKIGLKCGGSDGFSGITANPLVGRISDKLIAYGASSILTEVPEMFGAETILMKQAQDKEIFKKIVKLINGFKDYYIAQGQEIYENPSPGNKEGGITTLEEKSLGCTQKGGTGIVQGVNFYGDKVTKKGLQLLESPGNDLVSCTALTAAGANLILFTTGRGTPYGAPVPTVKISTNTPLAEKKAKWIDFNAGQLIEGTAMKTMTANFFNYLLKVVSKDIKTKNELNGYREIAILKTGVTL